jgi:hypothetical protein
MNKLKREEKNNIIAAEHIQVAWIDGADNLDNTLTLPFGVVSDLWGLFNIHGGTRSWVTM